MDLSNQATRISFQLALQVLSRLCRYFAPIRSSACSKGTTWRSFKHAVGPSFGTLTFGGTVLLLMEGIRNFLYRRVDFAVCSARCLLSCIMFVMSHGRCNHIMSSSCASLAGLSATDRPQSSQYHYAQLCGCRLKCGSLYTHY